LEIGTRQSQLGQALLFGLVIAVIAINLAGFGIWDPWELNAADAARRILEGEPAGANQPPFASIVAIGFWLLDVREWSGRLPIAVFGVVSSGIAFVLVRRFAGVGAGLLASFIAVTTPLFILGSRMMLGEAPGFALQGLIVAGGAFAVLEHDDHISRQRRIAWFAVMLGAIGATCVTRGALLGVLAPLLAVACVSMFQSPRTSPSNSVRALRWGLLGLAAAISVMCVRAVMLDAAESSIWIGGTPRATKPASFDSVVQRVFHAFAPWSALLPVAFGQLAMAPADDVNARRRRDLGWVCLIWIAVGYGAQTLFVSRYGDVATFLPVIALAATVALFLDDAHRGQLRSPVAALVSILFVGLLIRDVALYPAGPVEGLPINGFELPKAVNPRVYWAVGLSCFGLAAIIALALKEGRPHRLLAPYQLVRDQWRRGLGARLWLIAIGLLLALCAVGGLVAWIAPGKAHMSTLAAKIAKGASLVPLLLPIGIAIAQLAHNGLRRAFRFRLVPLVVVAAAIALYTSHGFLPTLSAHFSPREVYETYNRLATDADSLAEFKVGGRAATYYARGRVIDVKQQSDLLLHLNAKQRRWAAFPSDELATIDRLHRRTSGDHLFVVDTGSARITLATNQPLPGRQNESFLVRNVLRQPPKTIQFATRARFEDKIELLGYDLDLPHDKHVGASETFSIKWYFRALQPISGNYKIFLHVDGQGLRLNGDHDPLDGKYPVRLWDPGDVIIDEQELTVPANYRPGVYTFFLGFFSGNTRLKIEDGPKDDADRVRAGTLQIR